MSVLDALRAGPWREPAHAWLVEVRDKTGYGRGGRDRFADALVVSCYPSRGIWIAGVEVKVSRGDWKRELDDPTKAAAIQRYCDYWWVAAPPGVVEVSELPETWGLQVVEGKRCKVAKPAPRLTPEPLTATFVASVLRNASGNGAEQRQAGYREGFEAARKEHGSDVLRDKLSAAEVELIAARAAPRRLEEFAANVRLFEQVAGIEAGTIGERTWERHAVERAARAYQASDLLMHDEQAIKALEKRLRSAADALANL